MNPSVRHNSIEPETSFTSLSLWQVAGLILVISGSYLAVRIALLGMPPFTDGGAYACFAYFAHAGETALPAAPINFYPGCLSLLGCDPDAPLLRFRLADAAVCALAVGIASILIYRVSNIWIALSLGLLFAFAWLHPAIGNAGFKNSILPAFGCVAAALLLFTYEDTRAHVAGGALIPLIVLLREPMAIMALVVLASSGILQGRRHCAFAIIGCVTGSLIGLAWLGTFRGPPWQVLGNFADLQVMFEKFKAEGFSRWAAFTSSFLPMLSLWICAAVGLIAVAWQRESSKQPILLVTLLLLVVPLAEIFLKVCFAYHWMQLGLSLVLIAAVGFGSVLHACQTRRRWALAIGSSLMIALMVGQTYLHVETFRNYFHESAKFAPVMVSGNWDDPCVEDCFYLSLAKSIRTNSQPGEPLLVSGFYYVLYPLSQRMPADVRTFDASFATYADYQHRRAPWLTATQSGKSPAVVIETFRMDVQPMLRELVSNFPEQYSTTYEIPVDKPIRYAPYGARVWTRQDQAIPAISTNPSPDGNSDSSLR